MVSISAVRFFSDAFSWFAELSSKLPQIDFKTYFIVVVALLIGVGLIVGLTFFGSYRFKLFVASKKILRYLAGVDTIDDDNVSDFTGQCFSSKAPSALRDSWVQYLGVRFGYPSDIVSERAVYDEQIKRVREVRASVYIGIALVMIAIFAFWGYGVLDGMDMGVIFCTGLLLSGAIYIALVILNRALSKACLNAFNAMQEDLDAKVDLQVEKSYATDSSPLAELSAMLDEIIARNTAKDVGFETDENEETPIEKLIAGAQPVNGEQPAENANQDKQDAAQGKDDDDSIFDDDLSFNDDEAEISSPEKKAENDEAQENDNNGDAAQPDEGEAQNEQEEPKQEETSEEPQDNTPETSEEEVPAEETTQEEIAQPEEEYAAPSDDEYEEEEEENEHEEYEENPEAANEQPVTETEDGLSEEPEEEVKEEVESESDVDAKEEETENEEYEEAPVVANEQPVSGAEANLSEEPEAAPANEVDETEEQEQEISDNIEEPSGEENSEEEKSDEEISQEEESEDEEDEEQEVKVIEVMDYTDDESDSYVKPAKLVKLPNLIDYMLASNPSRNILMNISKLLITTHAKFENSPEDKQIVENCMNKVMSALQNYR